MSLRQSGQDLLWEYSLCATTTSLMKLARFTVGNPTKTPGWAWWKKKRRTTQPDATVQLFKITFRQLLWSSRYLVLSPSWLWLGTKPLPSWLRSRAKPPLWRQPCSSVLTEPFRCREPFRDAGITQKKRAHQYEKENCTAGVITITRKVFDRSLNVWHVLNTGHTDMCGERSQVNSG